jgi:hypothetical protein
MAELSLREEIIDSLFDVLHAGMTSGKPTSIDEEYIQEKTDSIISFILAKVEALKNPYYITGDYGRGTASWNHQPEFSVFEECRQAFKDLLEEK